MLITIDNTQLENSLVVFGISGFAVHREDTTPSSSESYVELWFPEGSPATALDYNLDCVAIPGTPTTSSVCVSLNKDHTDNDCSESSKYNISAVKEALGEPEIYSSVVINPLTVYPELSEFADQLQASDSQPPTATVITPDTPLSSLEDAFGLSDSFSDSC